MFLPSSVPFSQSNASVSTHPNIFCSRTDNLHIHFHDIDTSHTQTGDMLHCTSFLTSMELHFIFLYSIFMRITIFRRFWILNFWVKFMENVKILNSSAVYATTKRCRLLLMRAKCEQHDEEDCLKTVSERSLTDLTL